LFDTAHWNTGAGTVPPMNTLAFALEFSPRLTFTFPLFSMMNGDVFVKPPKQFPVVFHPVVAFVVISHPVPFAFTYPVPKLTRVVRKMIETDDWSEKFVVPLVLYSVMPVKPSWWSLWRLTMVPPRLATIATTKNIASVLSVMSMCFSPLNTHIPGASD
jgi:hypothetical protein